MTTELLDPPVAIAAPAAKAAPPKAHLNDHLAFINKYYAVTPLPPGSAGLATPLPMPTSRVDALSAASLLADLLSWWGEKGERWVSGPVVRELETARLPPNILSLTNFRPRETLTQRIVVRRACIVDGARFRDAGDQGLSGEPDSSRVRHAFAAVQRSLPVGSGPSIAAFNDLPGRGFPEVAGVVRNAIAKLEAVV